MTDRPAIKPLVWEEIHYNRSNEEPIPELTGWYAETEVGSYYVMLEGRIEVTLDGFQFHKVGSFDEPEAAFEAAQADFASRIRSCLLDKPEAVEGVVTTPPQLNAVSRWRVFEDTTHGYWGIEIDGGGDADPILYPIKINRERLDRIVDAHNAEMM
ncbi:hypothetical protein CN204_04425 [Sinorhizobium meliloti]|uniref:hypothetical protein n=1 Tax=Rhizobium meliloti TaxID=382 RepID=UPI000FDAF793|nr:hypothetical protein [Sinorhizobium meliloti]RVH87780.1 hypothetical protein CN204_04425 [Sinorhizobium meliloti]